MNLRTKNISDLVAADIDSLVANRVEEGSQLDFKSALVGGTNDDKKKFLADICAFANAQGGDLVLGVQEDSIGAAGEVIPLTFNPDVEIRRLESIISDGLDPKVFGVRMEAIPYEHGHVLVVRVPKSVRGTHRSRADQHFYVRESRSNRQLDVPAIRMRLEGEMTRHTRLEEFLAQRYAAVISNSLPVPMVPGPKVVVHIFQSLQGFGEEQLDVSAISDVAAFPVPTRPSGRDFRMAFDGPLYHSPLVDGRIRAFSLAHHVGVLEAVWKAGDAEPKPVLVSAESIEHHVLRFLTDALPAAVERLGFAPPFVIRVAVVGGEEAIIKSQNHHAYNYDPDMHLSQVGRSALVLPDVLLPTWPIENLPEHFRVCFDRLWQTSGYRRSSGYQLKNGVMVWQGQI
jgi:hypothetical protein